MYRSHLKLALFILVLVIGGRSSLSAQTEEQKKRFEEEKIAFYTERMELTDSEAAKFWIIHNDYHNRKMRIAEDEKSSMQYCYKNLANMSDEEVMQCNDK